MCIRDRPVHRAAHAVEQGGRQQRDGRGAPQPPPWPAAGALAARPGQQPGVPQHHTQGGRGEQPPGPPPGRPVHQQRHRPGDQHGERGAVGDHRHDPLDAARRHHRVHHGRAGRPGQPGAGAGQDRSGDQPEHRAGARDQRDAHRRQHTGGEHQAARPEPVQQRTDREQRGQAAEVAGAGQGAGLPHGQPELGAHLGQVQPERVAGEPVGHADGGQSGRGQRAGHRRLRRAGTGRPCRMACPACTPWPRSPSTRATLLSTARNRGNRVVMGQGSVITGSRASGVNDDVRQESATWPMIRGGPCPCSPTTA